LSPILIIAAISATDETVIARFLFLSHTVIYQVLSSRFTHISSKNIPEQKDAYKSNF
jgi:hypothetical protein